MSNSAGHVPPTPPPTPPPPHRPPAGPLLDLRLLVLITVSALVGLLVGFLAWQASNPWAAALVGLGAAGLALERLHTWTGP